MRREVELVFDGTDHFSMNEWPDHKNTLTKMNDEVFEALFDVRADLPPDHGMHPSPLVEAHVRYNDPGSRHDTNKGRRYSDATDFFVKREHAKLVYATLMAHPALNGIGIYQNSVYNGEKGKWTMFHIDTRPQSFKSLWVAVRGDPTEPFTYYGYLSDTKRFFDALTQKGFFD
jgi:hypothetical protein